MNNESLSANLHRWSLERVQFVLSEMAEFVESNPGEKPSLAHTQEFVAQTGLEKVERLVDSDPNDPNLALLLLNRLTAFYESGMLIQKGLSSEQPNWWVTNLFWRGQVFALKLEEQIEVSRFVPEMTPMQVHRSPAKAFLDPIQLSFLADADVFDAYLMRPTPNTAFVLTSRLAAPWSADHVSHTLRLLNRSFLY